MMYRGTVRNGVVVLEGSLRPQEGATVSVLVLKVPSPRVGVGRKSPLIMYDRYKRFIAKAQGLPADFSINHDHYLYGTPRRTRSRSDRTRRQSREGP